MTEQVRTPAIDTARYMASVQADADRILSLAPDCATSAVRGCPGWTVEMVVRHLGEVYLRQSTAISRGGRVPPGDPVGALGLDEDVFANFERARSRILTAIDRPADTSCWTWSNPAGRIGFWQRRMAQETLVHRVDVEQAAGLASRVDEDLAVDGVDEVLRLFLPLSLPIDGPAFGIEPRLRASVVVSAGAVSWSVEVAGLQAQVTPGFDAGAAAYVCGEPGAVLLWLWGRSGGGDGPGADDAVTLEGDADQVTALRQALVAATQ